MADYCEQCTREHLGEGLGNDVAHIVQPGFCVPVLCEGCGATWVDFLGRCIGPCAGTYPDGTFHAYLGETHDRLLEGPTADTPTDDTQEMEIVAQSGSLEA